MEGSVQKRNKQDNEQVAETPTDNSNTSTSSCNAGSNDTSRENTPVPMPKYRYGKEELMKIRDTPLSKNRPPCLAAVHFNADGHWDPEIWFRSFDSSRGNSPVTTGGPRERKRPADLDKESVYKRKTADPKVRVREEEEEGIVLSPQRRSFGTGCHVSINTTRRNTSPNDTERESQPAGREHRKNGKIGSGRIQINHDRHEREYHETRGRYERDRDEHKSYDRPNPLDRYRRDERDNRIRERDKERNTERERPPRREYEREGRYPRDGRSGRHYNRYPEEEPEWFTGGPSSQSETIELHGFEGPNRDSGDRNRKSATKKDVNRQREDNKTNNSESGLTEQHEEQKEGNEQTDAERPSSHTGSLSVADRNGSLETNESSSAENSPHHEQTGDTHQVAAGVPDFDFNVFFKTENINIPGLTDTLPVEQDVPTSGSRFSQWFHGGSHHSSHTNSRRSSINDEFGYLNDLLNQSSGQKSPVIPSPPLIDPHSTYHNVYDIKRASPEQQQQSLLEMLHNASRGGGRIPDDLIIHNTKPDMPEKALAASEVEANLKAILMGGMSVGAKTHDSIRPKMYGTATQPPAPIRGKVLTAEELEACLMGGDSKLTDQHVGKNDKKLPHHGLSSTPDGVHNSLPLAVMPSFGKVKTVSELEAGLKQLGFSKDVSPAGTITAASKQLSMEVFLSTKETQHNDMAPAHAPSDMNAFNKLLGMMKASGVLPEPPRMPQKKQDGRSMSPVSLLSQPDVSAQHQKDVLQKLIQQQQAKLLQQQQQAKLQQQAKIQQQQQQVKQQLHQHQKQQQVQDQILKFMKQNPGLIPKAAANTSPISPSLNLMPPASPRCPSPGIPQQTLLQPSPSPRAPSPIMFGSQPPMHLTAPSPIHPTQLPQSSQTLSPNTLQVGQGSSVQMMQRVPSPQELIVHTQAIMQNALLKKQLEGQKERFLKKQQDRVKSPNPMASSVIMNTPSSVTSVSTSTPVSTRLTPGFTPTSVIRKMVSEKVEKQQEANEQMSPEKKMPILRIMHSDSLEDAQNSEDGISTGQPEYISHKIDTPPIMTVASDGSISIPVPVTPIASSAGNPNITNEKSNQDAQENLHLNSQVNMAQNVTSAQLNQKMLQGTVGGSSTTNQPLSTQNPAIHHIASSASQGSPSHLKHPRAVMGSGVMNTQSMQAQSQVIPQSVVQVHPQSVAQILNVSLHGSTGQLPPGRPIVKGAGQISVISSAGQQRSISGGSSIQQKLDSLVASRPIVGNQHNVSQAQKTVQQIAVRSSGPASNPTLSCTPATQFGSSVTGCIPLQTGLVRPGTVGFSPPTSNPILMQRMVHPSVTMPTAGRAGLSPRMINQLSPLNALQTAQHRSLDPRIQTGRNIYASGVPPLMAANTSPRATFPVSAMSRALSPQPQIGQPLVSFNKHDVLTGPISPGLVQHTGLNANLNALLGAQGAIDNNLAKWFSSDVLKQQNSPMPPLPGQGQKVMTVDEIERRQQMVTN